jgi:pimeloyl-ACP methyl ester carboxylesterase
MCWLILLCHIIAVPAASASHASRLGLDKVDCWFEVPARHAATCYRLTVPESRDEAAHRTLTLPVAVLSNPAMRRHDDPMVYLTGGPGSAVGIYPDTIAEWWPYMDEVPWLQGRDLILMDQRGAGLSEPSLDCPEIEQAGMSLLKLSGEPARRRALYESAAEACRKAWVAAGFDLGSFDTTATAADFAELRSALGIAQWNLYGISYGTRVALTLMRDDPAGLRSVILDSVYPPEYRFFEGEFAAIERAFDAVAQSCAADEMCHRAVPDLKKAATSLIERYRANPVTVALADQESGTVEEVPVTGALLLERMIEIINEEDALRELPVLLNAAAAGDPGLLEETVAGLAGAYTGPNRFSEGRYFAVDCEEEIPFTDQARLRAEIAKRPLFENFGLASDDRHLCPAWIGEDARRNDKEPIASDVPALVLQGSFDALTPPELGRRTASRLRHGYYVEFPEVGHKVVDQSICGQIIAAKFLEKPTREPKDPCLSARPQRPIW